MVRPRFASSLPSHQSLVVSRMDADATEHAVIHDHAPSPVVHPHASLAFFEGGNATIRCGATYTLTPGDVLLVPEGMPHYGVDADSVEFIGLAMCTSCMTSP